MFDTFKKLLSLFTVHERRKAAFVLLLVMIMALLETIGVASVLPFLAVLGNPDTVYEHKYLSQLYTRLEFTDLHDFLIVLGVSSFLIILLSAAFRVATIFAMNRFISMRRHSLSERLLETYLRQPYAFFLRRHSGDMANKILSETDLVIGNALTPCLNIAAYLVVVVALISLLIFADPMLAIAVGSIISFMYLLTYLSIRKVMVRMGEELTSANSERFTSASESLSGIKAIKILGRELAYLSRFSPASKRFAQCQSTAGTVSEVPRYVVEAIGIGGILLLAIILMATRDGVGSVLPVLGLYAFAGYKLIPAAQRIYEGIAKLRYAKSAVEGVHKDLLDRADLAEITNRDKGSDIHSFHKEIKLQGLSFTYSKDISKDSPLALTDINICIPKGTTVGVIGTTGSGKTTLLDIILGLLTPTEGQLIVGDSIINKENIRDWQNSLGYVPQEIFLTDSTIAENIALGVPEGEIDIAQVEQCANIAQLHQFITEELEEQYQTKVGERGVRLSGGQRQRIGIARALYHNSPVLVFDEATSALDNQTEQVLMESVRELSSQKTIIMVAHRLSTVRQCDQIFLMDKGKLLDAGTYDELVIAHPHFFNS